jgi:two-component system, LytTR family, response regulator
MPNDLAVPPRASLARAGGERWPSLPVAPAEPLRRIAVRTSRCFSIVAVESILRLAADDNYVVVWADRAYRHKATLDAVCARLDPARFVRIHRSHAVNVTAVRELSALGRGEYRLVLRDGTALRTGRRFARVVTAAFGLDDER